MSERQFDRDFIFVGGGLANGLMAFGLKAQYPDLRIFFIEKAPALDQTKTWSFHQSDLRTNLKPLLLSLASKSWPHYEVRFPEHHRKIESSYYSIRSETFFKRLTSEFEFEFGVDVVGTGPFNVTSRDGRTWSAPCIVDGRGFPEVDPSSIAYQKFVGLDVELEAPHGLTGPILMDSTCLQKEGFRFFYCLPWDKQTLLIEDTRYTEFAEINESEFKDEIFSYAEKQGWKIKCIHRVEKGVLPIPLRKGYLKGGKNPEEHWMMRLVPSNGVGAGFFHPTTGYSLPDAIKLSSKFVALPDYSHESIYNFFVREFRRRRFAYLYFRFLNRLLFFGAPPLERYKILQRFYRLPKSLIGRFYSGRMWPTDYIRLFLGAPPIKISAALSCLLHRREVSDGN